KSPNWLSLFRFRASSFVRHSSFVIYGAAASLHRLEFYVALAAPDAVAPAFQFDDHRTSAVIRRVLQFLFVNSRIVLEPIIVDRALRISRPVDVRMNVRRRGPMRIRSRPDRAEF